MSLNKKIIIISIMMLMSVNNAIAESGTITLDSNSVYSDYSFGGVAVATTIDFTKIGFLNSAYNKLTAFQIKGANLIFDQDSNSSDFTVTSGAVGSCYGTSYFNKTGNYVSWIFNDCIISSSQMVLSYSKSGYTSHITGTVTGKLTSSLTSTSPMAIYDSSGNLVQAVSALLYYTSNLGVRTSENYFVNYSTLNNVVYFNIDIIKAGNVGLKNVVKSNSIIYNQESTYNTNAYTVFRPYQDGLIVNVSSLSVTSQDIIINSTFGTPTLVSGIILFNKSSYDIYDDFNISYTITNPNTTILNSGNYKWKLLNWDTGIYEIFGTIYQNPHSEIISNVVLTDRLTPHLYSIELWSYSGAVGTLMSTQTIYYGASTTLPTGNVTLLNTTRIQGQTLFMKYNASTSSKIVLVDGNLGTVYNYFVSSGNNIPFSIYIPDDFSTGYNYIRLYYQNIAGDWYLLDQKSFTVTSSGGSSLTVEKPNYVQGDQLRFFPYSSSNGYVVLKNPSGIVKNNISYTASEFPTLTYTTSVSDEVGIYTGYLYNSAGSLLNSTTTNVGYGMQTPAPTSTSVGTISGTPVTIIDITSNLSEQLFGKIDTNSDGLNSNDELASTGNKFLSTLVLIVIILLISGIFATRKR